MTRASWVLCVAVSSAVVLAATTARADGLIDLSLAPSDRAALEVEIRASRPRLDPIFARVRAPRGLDPQVYRRTRARRPEVTRELRALGPDALVPMLDPKVAIEELEYAVRDLGFKTAVFAGHARRSLGDGGAFLVKNVPPGTYTVEAWHEKFGTQSQSVTVGAKEAKTVSFTFKAATP